MVLSDMAMIWKMKEFLAKYDITAYRLKKESGIGQGTVYRLAKNEADGIELDTLDAALIALCRLTGKHVKLSDVLEFRR